LNKVLPHAAVAEFRLPL